MTEYLPLQNIDKTTSGFTGGICRWWFIPVEDIASFPPVDPVTQQLTGEPVLKVNKSWYGPVKVPDAQLGWKQVYQKSGPGGWYKQSVEGFVPGNSPDSYNNLGNLADHKFCIIAKLRTKGMLVVIGTDESGLDLAEDTDSGVGAKDTPGTKIMFTGESIRKALVLPALYIDDASPFLVDGDGVIIADGDDAPINPL